MAALKQRRVISAQNFELRLVGRYVGELSGAIKALKIDDLVTITPTVPHAEAVRMQMESTALLFLMWSGTREKGWFSAKLYEYMGIGRPILAIGPADNVGSKLIESANAGELAETSEQVERVLSSWI